MAKERKRGDKETTLQQPVSLRPMCYIVEYVQNTNHCWRDSIITYEQISKEARRGCSICHFVLQTIPPPAPPRKYYDYEMSAAANWLFIKSSTTGREDVGVDFQLFGEPDISYSTDPRGREVSEDPKSEECFALIKGWIDECLSSTDHDPYCSKNDKSLLPTRLLDVGRTKRQVFLCSPEEQHGKYVILSHCWGSEPMFTTTTNTLKERELGIPYFDLPLTFQDAVIVTRRLGVQYLWIDSLCILQDSKEDWHTESLKMGRYYKDSYFAISALDSVNCHGGFLKPRTPTSSVPWSDSPNLHLRVKPKATAELLGKAAISSRAWCYQERLLPTRVVHYGLTEVLWECMTCGARESDYGITDSPVVSVTLLNHKSRDSDVHKRQLVNVLSGFYSSINGFRQLDDWYPIVTDFSQRQLTYASDKIPAILGVASVIKQATGFTFCQGIWKEDLIRGLLWCAESRDILPATNPEGDRILEYPSWTWACIPGPISYRLIYNGSDSNVPFFQGDSLDIDDSGLEICMETRGRILHLEVIPKNEDNNAKLVEVVLKDDKDVELGIGQLDVSLGAESAGTCMVLCIAHVRSTFPGEHDKPLLEETILLIRRNGKDDSKWIRFGIGTVGAEHGVFEECEYKTFILG